MINGIKMRIQGHGAGEKMFSAKQARKVPGTQGVRWVGRESKQVKDKEN